MKHLAEVATVSRLVSEMVSEHFLNGAHQNIAASLEQLLGDNRFRDEAHKKPHQCFVLGRCAIDQFIQSGYS
ncbi:hypothetical protein D3C84_573120 [compost metagenome]